MSFLEMLTARLAGRKIGRDAHGNTYFESRRVVPVYNRTRRYVVTAGAQEATKVPPEWHAWLHHTTEAPLDERRRHAWQKDHQPNLTGTAQAWRPRGHEYSGGHRALTTGDYEAWSPEAPGTYWSPEAPGVNTSPEATGANTSHEAPGANNRP